MQLAEIIPLALFCLHASAVALPRRIIEAPSRESHDLHGYWTTLADPSDVTKATVTYVTKNGDNWVLLPHAEMSSLPESPGVGTLGYVKQSLASSAVYQSEHASGHPLAQGEKIEIPKPKKDDEKTCTTPECKSMRNLFIGLLLLLLMVSGIGATIGYMMHKRRKAAERVKKTITESSSTIEVRKYEESWPSPPPSTYRFGSDPRIRMSTYR